VSRASSIERETKTYEVLDALLQSISGRYEEKRQEALVKSLERLRY
jgi:hypothetical protein